MISVAIDGPAGAGKSTVARAAAKELGYIYVDTGALYRAVGLYMLQHGISVSDEDAVVKELSTLQVSLEFRGGEQHVLLCGEDVSAQIRTPEVSMAASAVSAMQPVRSFLFDLQKNMAKQTTMGRYDRLSIAASTQRTIRTRSLAAYASA